MRVDGQGMALDYFPAKTGTPRPVADKDEAREPREKVGLQDLMGKGKPVPEDLKQAVGMANEAIKISNYHLEFQLHENSGRYQVKVVDSTSQEVIREIPPEYMLDFSARVKQMLSKEIGLLVDEFA